MKCYACEKLPEYSCSCSSPIFLICHNDLKSHIEDKTKKHNLKVWDYPEETSLYLFAREGLMKIIAELLSETKEKLFKIKKNLKEKIDNVNNLTRELDEKFKTKNLNRNSIEIVYSNLRNSQHFDLEELTKYIGMHLIGSLLKVEEKNESQAVSIEADLREEQEIERKVPVFIPSIDSENKIIKENKSNSTLVISDATIWVNQAYIIKNVSSGEYLYISNDEKGGDKVLESRQNILDSCIFFIISTEQGFMLKNAAFEMTIFLAEGDRIWGDRVVEAATRIGPKSYFEIYYKEGKGWSLKSVIYSEWLFLSGNKLSGDRVVEAKNALEERSFFQFIKAENINCSL